MKSWIGLWYINWNPFSLITFPTCSSFKCQSSDVYFCECEKYQNFFLDRLYFISYDVKSKYIEIYYSRLGGNINHVLKLQSLTFGLGLCLWDISFP